MIRSLRWRLQAWHAFILVLVVSGFGMALFFEIRKSRLDEIDAELIASARILEGGLRLYPADVLLPGYRDPPRPGPPGRRPLPTRGRLAQLLSLPKHFVDRYADDDAQPYYVVWYSDGRILKAEPSPVKSPFQAPPFAATNLSARPVVRQRDRNREVILAGPESTQILVGRSIDRELAQQALLAGRFLLTGGLVLVVGLLGGWWLSRKIVRPIQLMSATAAGINASNLSWRIDLKGVDDELGVLGEILNSMFERLQHAFEQQVRFTADASHELRTPLSVILYHTELALSRPRGSEEYCRALETCQRAAGRMKVLVEGLLTLARADAGRLELRRQPVDLRQLIEECVDQFQPLAKLNRIRLTVAGQPVETLADPDQLAQIVTNLIGNAIRYNRPDGTVRATCSCDETAALLTVADTGVGIAAEQLDRIFDRFSRVDEARSRESGGSGLGLAICKSIVDAHGGTIGVASQVNVGTKFTVRLPLA